MRRAGLILLGLVVIGFVGEFRAVGVRSANDQRSGFFCGPSSQQSPSVMPQMILYERGDEVITVIVAFVESELE